MADIPSYLAGQSAQTGPTGPTANPAEFGGQMAQSVTELGMGLEHGARLAGRAVNRMQLDQAARQHYDDTRWSGEAYEQEKRLMSEFMANPENNQKETFAQDLDKFVQGRLKQYTGDSAPSPRALDMFKAQYLNFSTSAYDHALNKGYANAINNGIQSVGTQINDMAQTYHNTRGVNEDFARLNLLDSVAHIGNNIESNYRQRAPGIADEMQNQLTTTAVMSSVQNHPELAKMILDNSQHLDEKTRYHLDNMIREAAGARNAVEIEGFNKQRQDNLLMSDIGRGGDKIPLSTYKQYYPDDKAQVLKSRDDAQIDINNRANQSISELAPLEGGLQLQRLANMQAGVRNEDDMEVLKKVSSAVRENVQLQDHNPVSWLQQYNPVVKSLLQQAKDAPANMQAGAINDLNAAVLRFQGPPPPDAAPGERGQYLNRPIAERHLLGADEARQMASELNSSNPQEFIKKMGDMLGRYPDPKHQMIAFNDLVTLPGGRAGLRQEYQLAWQNKDAWWLDTYLGAIKGSRDITIPEPDKKSIEERIDGNKTWLQFKSAMVGDNFSRAHELDGFREGMNMYARALTTQGKGPKEAADSAINMLISETLGITKVNGRPMVVLRDQGNGRMADQQVDDLGRRLGLALRFVDPREVDQAPFASLRLFGNDEQHLPRLQALRDSITARGFFQTGPDGKSASLYYTDDNGSIFQVRDRKGMPFNINFRDLPPFEPKIITMSGAKMVPGIPETFPSGLPAKHYDLGSEDHTNWPMHVDWLHAPAKP